MSLRFGLPLAVLVFAAVPAGQQIPDGPADGAISGTVYDGVTHQPVAGVVVHLEPFVGPTGQADARVTDEKGRFVFDGVGHGPRSLTAHKPGYLESVYGLDRPVLGTFLENVVGMSATSYSGLAPIRLTSGQWLEGADLTLWPAASVSGTVTDEYGEPFVDQVVSVLALDPVAGHPRWSNVGTALTDDRGRYSVGRLAPGRYVIVAPAAAPPDQTAGALRPGRYYPGAVRLTDATPVVVAAGARMTGLDIARLPTPALRVSGRVTGAGDRDWPPLLLALTRAGDPDLGSREYVATTLLEPNGTFVFPRVPPGTYVIKTSPTVSQEHSSVEIFPSGPNQLARQWPVAMPRDAVSAPYFGHTSVTVGDADLPNVIVALENGVTLSGVVTSDAASGRDPDGVPGGSVFAEPADGGPVSKTARLDSAGAFAIDGLAPGAYFLRTFTARTPIRSIRVGGRENLDQPIDAVASVAGISVGLMDGASIHGDIQRSSTSASVRATVIYFPSDRQLWTQASSRSPRFGCTYVNTDGTYDIPPVVPGGDYYVVAVPQDRWLDTWRNPAFLDAAARGARNVHLDWAARIQVDLKIQEVRLP